MGISSTNVPLADELHTAHHTVDIDLVSEGEHQRRDIERFIKLVFRQAYGARVNHFLPYLLSMRQDGNMLAALGICPAVEKKLFLETYLNAPIENTLAAQLKRPIDRSSIVEVGNLSSSHGGGARALIITLTAYLSGAGYKWAVFTATPQVRNSFAKLGIELTPLTHADKSRLGDEQHRWGNYYEQAPVVVAGNIADGTKNIRSAMSTKQLFPTAQQLWDDAENAGRQGCLWQPPHSLSDQWPEWALEDDFDYTD
ncbi:thermostable hemolysin [Pseudomonadota bacterium]